MCLVTNPVELRELIQRLSGVRYRLIFILFSKMSIRRMTLCLALFISQSGTLTLDSWVLTRSFRKESFRKTQSTGDGFLHQSHPQATQRTHTSLIASSVQDSGLPERHTMRNIVAFFKVLTTQVGRLLSTSSKLSRLRTPLRRNRRRK